MSQHVSYALEGGVAQLTLDHPKTYNALDMDVLGELSSYAKEASLDPAVRCLLVTGRGPAFCAGGDVRSLRKLATSETPEADVHTGVGAMHEALVTLFRCPKPIIAAVNGPCAGAGIGLMLTADIIWSARSAHFTLAFTAIGASPDGGTTFLLPRVVGPKMAAELLITNRRLSADEALSLGLVTRVLDDQALLSEAMATARCLAAGPSGAFAGAKELLRTSLLSGYEAQLEEERRGMMRAVASDDFVEGVGAFLEKRAPQFV